MVKLSREEFEKQTQEDIQNLYSLVKIHILNLDNYTQICERRHEEYRHRFNRIIIMMIFSYIALIFMYGYMSFFFITKIIDFPELLSV